MVIFHSYVKLPEGKTGLGKFPNWTSPNYYRFESPGVTWRWTFNIRLKRDIYQTLFSNYEVNKPQFLWLGRGSRGSRYSIPQVAIAKQPTENMHHSTCCQSLVRLSSLDAKTILSRDQLEGLRQKTEVVDMPYSPGKTNSTLPSGELT